MTMYEAILRDEEEKEELIRFYRSQEAIYCQGYMTCKDCPRSKQKCSIKEHLKKE